MMQPTQLYDAQGNALMTKKNPATVRKDLGSDYKAIKRSGNLANSATETVMDVNKAIIIDHIFINTSNKGLKIQLFFYDKNAVLTPHYVPWDQGTGEDDLLTMNTINAKYSSIFETLSWEDGYQYIAKLRGDKSLELPFGCKIVIINTTGAALNAAFVINYREI